MISCDCVARGASSGCPGDTRESSAIKLPIKPWAQQHDWLAESPGDGNPQDRRQFRRQPQHGRGDSILRGKIDLCFPIIIQYLNFLTCASTHYYFRQKCLHDMVDNQTKMDSIRSSYEAFCGLCDPSLLETLRERVEDLTQEWQRIQERLGNKISSLKVSLSFIFSLPSVTLLRSSLCLTDVITAYWLFQILMRRHKMVVVQRA